MPADAPLESAIQHGARLVEKILNEVGKAVVGQDHLRRRLVTALMTEGHVLLEGVPGLAKTLSIRALAQAVDASFQRIQFTPDLLPSDVVGTEVFRPQTGSFDIRKGPVFANFVLADEINSAKCSAGDDARTAGDNRKHLSCPTLAVFCSCNTEPS